MTIAVLDNDSDPEGDPLTVAEISTPAHGAARLTGAGAVEYTPEPDYHGADRFTYVVGDGSGLTAQAAVDVTVLPVNDPPEVLGVIPDQTLEAGDGPASLDLSPYFEDRDGDSLGYTAVASDAVALSLAGATLTLTVARPGAATVTVTAQDPGGLTAAQAFLVTTSDRQARGVVEDTLAAMGRGHLASARATLGRRAAATGREESRITVAGMHVPLGTDAAAAAGRALAERWITGLAGGMGAGWAGMGAGAGAFGPAGAGAFGPGGAGAFGLAGPGAFGYGGPEAFGPAAPGRGGAGRRTLRGGGAGAGRRRSLVRLLRPVAVRRPRPDRVPAGARRGGRRRFRAGAALDGMGPGRPAGVPGRAVAGVALRRRPPDGLRGRRRAARRTLAGRRGGGAQQRRRRLELRFVDGPADDPTDVAATVSAVVGRRHVDMGHGRRRQRLGGERADALRAAGRERPRAAVGLVDRALAAERRRIDLAVRRQSAAHGGEDVVDVVVGTEIELLEPAARAPDRCFVHADRHDVELAALGSDVGGHALSQRPFFERHPVDGDAGIGILEVTGQLLHLDHVAVVYGRNGDLAGHRGRTDSRRRYSGERSMKQLHVFPPDRPSLVDHERDWRPGRSSTRISLGGARRRTLPRGRRWGNGDRVMEMEPGFGFRIPRMEIISGHFRVLVENFAARIFCGADS